MKYSSSLSSMFMAITEGLLPASENPIGELELSFPIIVPLLCVLCYLYTHTPSISIGHSSSTMDGKGNMMKKTPTGEQRWRWERKSIRTERARVQTSRVREEFLACGSNFFSSLCFSLLFFSYIAQTTAALCLDESFIFSSNNNSDKRCDT